MAIRIFDPDIYRAACADAATRMTVRADELLEEGDIEGAAVWRAIVVWGCLGRRMGLCDQFPFRRVAL